MPTSRKRRIFETVGTAALVAVAFGPGCGASAARDASIDVLRGPAPRPPMRVGTTQLSSPTEYQELVRWGEWWFRTETFGGERAATDVAGLFQAEVEIPCRPVSPGAQQDTSPCREKTSVLPYLIRALDRLDGVEGNLFKGNGGKLGTGYTSDLVIEFPPGTMLAGLPVPEHLHTGLDVDAGYPWPIGIEPVKVLPTDEKLPYLVELSTLGAGPADPGKYRLGITCALCHYSLDVDKDGRADMRSSRWDEPTPGSLFEPHHAWGIGNQDAHFGWLFALTRNPLMGFTVLSGPVGKNDPEDALSWVKWVKDNYKRAPETVRREVIRGMLVQPRGLADDTPNALHDANQLPILFTNRNWPYNYDGSFISPSDRNNGVWTGAIDFTGLISLTKDRSQGRQGFLFWERASVYSLLDAEEYADIVVDQSPAVLADPGVRRALKDDILGFSDGIPGLLDPDSVVIMKNELGAVPNCLFTHPENIRKNRIRSQASYGGDASNRGSMMVLLGTRVITRPKVRKELDLEAWLKRYPQLNPDDFQSDAVSAMLDWLTPPPNRTALLYNARHLVRTGYEIFKSEGCARCHAGSFLTDNDVERLYARRSQEIGIAAPSTSGFRSLGRGRGPALLTTPNRSIANRELQLFVAPPYDPENGLATAPGGPLRGFFGTRPVGYKTLTLRYLWGSAPYLHDGGVAVSLRPGSVPAEDRLETLLARGDTDKMYGMASLLAYREQHQTGELWPNAALSLQGLLLRSEREKIIADNRAPIVPVPVGSADNPLNVPSTTSLALLGVQGIGHEFWVNDVPGGERITSLVAFLLALDDDPSDPK